MAASWTILLTYHEAFVTYTQPNNSRPQRTGQPPELIPRVPHKCPGPVQTLIQILLSLLHANPVVACSRDLIHVIAPTSKEPTMSPSSPPKQPTNTVQEDQQLAAHKRVKKGISVKPFASSSYLIFYAHSGTP